MRITDLLKQDTMILELSATSKSDIIEELASKLDEAGRLHDKTAFIEAIQAREEQSTTGIGEGIAIPHAKTAAVKEPAIAFARSEEGLDYESLDGQSTHLFFMIAASEDAGQAHLETLSSLSTLLMDEAFRQKLLAAESREEVVQLIDRKENENTTEEEETSESAKQSEEAYVIAVTACPTGIAHTYMAADKLKATAKEMGVRIKVETNGSSGVKNRLTSEDIERAKGVIVAADIEVATDRFKGKHVVQVPVAKGIHEPEQLITKAVEQNAPIFQGGGDEEQKESSEKETRSGFYKHIMNGVSNMLPFVVGGGILLALAFFIETFTSSDNELVQLLMTIGGDNAFFLLVPVLAGFISQSIAGRPGLAPGMTGGLIAITVGASSSGFLGGLIAGFLAGYVTLLVIKVFEKLPSSLDGLKTVLFYPVFSILITGVIMALGNPLLGQLYGGLQTWLEGLGTSNLILIGVVVGGMMAVDMGGPFNKAAYTFGLAMIDAGNYEYMAAIMAGGMTPPLGLALATTFFKKKFTKQERETGKSAYALGLSFITEGAIPFAAADPARVIPSAVVGSAIAGALSMLFSIGSQAPHGGVFAAALVSGSEGLSAPFPQLLYLLAIVIGSIVTALLVGVLKKDIKS
ncbi:PTS fructose transporter subunit IIC [Pontibacillus halophilus JSM 076056 = DSM 19796]|uniref:PTS fructose transporter subunit IIC n=1 Tax=Pontibacillus halophilus JSM 076056 = DSM 19796 TaxID=1385510 RepID=A0A0A5GNQ6_9BACI|nr:fructose-specific PTS transporter subunit EIIC [Pontibacillus halophilus]KGX92878.1 PTS fructose transporter subunit IIC [Pontibacillus halophilus JSM 076056 = DSM 19796]